LNGTSFEIKRTVLPCSCETGTGHIAATEDMRRETVVGITDLILQKDEVETENRKKNRSD
jgi:hypothetical protein